MKSLTKKKLTITQKQEKARQASAEWRKSHPNYGKETARKWRRENPERYLAGVRKWRKENPEQDKELTRRASAAWKKRNPNHSVAYYQHNRKRLLKQNAKYVKAHPEWNVAKKHKRRAKERSNGGEYTALQWINLKLFYDKRCLCCRRRELVLVSLGLRLVPDHIVAISKGGTNAISNIQPLCHGKGGCNNKKGSRYADYRSIKENYEKENYQANLHGASQACHGRGCGS
jgi:HNH endonuclease